MRLPDALSRALEVHTAQNSVGGLTRAAADLSAAYREPEFTASPLKTAAHRLAYLQVRLPATYAACAHVFARTRAGLPAFQPRSLLDLGAGPGTAAWAALEQFPSIEKISLVERDPEMVRIGKELAAGSEHSALRDAAWQVGDLRTTPFETHDMVVLSYALGELKTGEAEQVIRAAWQRTPLLVLTEPGTPKAFARLAEVRRQLIAAGATLAAPCPHERACPLLARGDWCHFAERLERTAEHRRIKGGSLGYEDEKFCYFAATRLPIADRAGRIVRHPMIHSGYVRLQVCASEELQQITVTKSQKEAYRRARKSKWGDGWH